MGVTGNFPRINKQGWVPEKTWNKYAVLEKIGWVPEKTWKKNAILQMICMVGTKS